MAARKAGSARSSLNAAASATGERGRHEDAAAVGEQLSRVGVRRGDDGPAGAHRVRHGPGHDLVEVGIGRDEDVCRLEPALQLDPPDIPIDESDMVLEPQSVTVATRRLAVGLALGCEGGPGGSHRRSTYSTDGCAATTSGSAAMRELVALARAKQAEAQDHVATVEARAAGLTVTGSTSGSSGTPCGMTWSRSRSTPYALVSRSAADRDMTTVASALATSSERTARWRGCRVLQDRVQRGDRRDPERPDEVETCVAVLAAPDPVLVLDRDDVDAPAQGLRRPKVVGRLVASDPMVDLDRIGDAAAPADEGPRPRGCW